MAMWQKWRDRRLIDADKIDFGKVFIGASEFAKDTREAAQKLIAEQPTAYDVDKAVEKLQTELSYANDEKERCYRENQLQLDVAKGYAHGVWFPLEIVKSCGIV